MPVDIKAIREALGKATHGSWILDTRVGIVAIYAGPTEYNCLAGISDRPEYVAHWNGREDDDGRRYFRPQELDNARLIANAPEWLSSLCDEVERLRVICDCAKSLIVQGHADKLKIQDLVARVHADKLRIQDLEQRLNTIAHIVGPTSDGMEGKMTADIEFIREALDNLVDSPWYAEYSGIPEKSSINIVAHNDTLIARVYDDNDADLIANAPAWLNELITEVHHLRNALQRISHLESKGLIYDPLGTVQAITETTLHGKENG